MYGRLEYRFGYSRIFSRVAIQGNRADHRAAFDSGHPHDCRHLYLAATDLAEAHSIRRWAFFRPTGSIAFPVGLCCPVHGPRSEEHTSELQSLMRISSAVFCLKKKKQITKKI